MGDFQRLSREEKHPLASGSPTYNTFRSLQAAAAPVPVTMASSAIPAPTSEFHVHKMTGKETIQGLSIMYNVSIQGILGANKLWSRDDILTREFLLIPRPTKPHKSSTAAVAAARTAERDIESEVTEFRRVTGTTTQVARYYVETHCDGTSLVAAIQRYREDMASAATLGGTGRATSPSRQPLMGDTSSSSDEDDRHHRPKVGVAPDVAAVAAAAAVHYQSPNRPTRLGVGRGGRRQAKIPQLDNFIDSFYDGQL